MALQGGGGGGVARTILAPAPWPEWPAVLQRPRQVVGANVSRISQAAVTVEREASYSHLCSPPLCLGKLSFPGHGPGRAESAGGILPSSVLPRLEPACAPRGFHSADSPPNLSLTHAP